MFVEYTGEEMLNPLQVKPEVRDGESFITESTGTEEFGSLDTTNGNLTSLSDSNSDAFPYNMEGESLW